MLARKILGIFLTSLIIVTSILIVVQSVINITDYIKLLSGSGRTLIGVYIASGIVIVFGVLSFAFGIPSLVSFCKNKNPKTGHLFFASFLGIKYWILILTVANALLAWFMIPMLPAEALGSYFKTIFGQWQIYVAIIGLIALPIIFGVARGLRHKHRLGAAITTSIGMIGFSVCGFIVASGSVFAVVIVVLGLICLILLNVMQYIEVAIKYDPNKKPKKVRYVYVDENGNPIQE